MVANTVPQAPGQQLARGLLTAVALDRSGGPAAARPLRVCRTEVQAAVCLPFEKINA